MDSAYTIVGIWRGLFEEIYVLRDYGDAVKKWEDLAGISLEDYDLYNKNASNKQITEYYLNAVSVD